LRGQFQRNGATDAARGACDESCSSGGGHCDVPQSAGPGT
jgi:hypothetical protein